MSLINEALKRARQVPVAPAPELHFRPVEAPPAARRTFGLMLPVVLAGVALVALLLVWQLSHRSASSDGNPAVASVTEPTPAAITPPADSAPAQTSKLPTAASPAPVPDSPAAAATATNAAPAAEPPPPPPPPLKLQGVVYNPQKPSALINGRTVFIGDRVRDFRVVAISSGTATLVGAGQTNVLSLAE